MATSARFQLKRDTTANWLASTIRLQSGEPGYDTDKHELRIGDGIKLWSQLTSISGGSGAGGNPLIITFLPTDTYSTGNYNSINLHGEYASGLDPPTNGATLIITSSGKSDITISNITIPFVTSPYVVNIYPTNFEYARNYLFTFKDAITGALLGSRELDYRPPYSLVLVDAFVTSSTTIGLRYRYTGPKIDGVTATITDDSSVVQTSSSFIINTSISSGLITQKLSNTVSTLVITPGASYSVTFTWSSVSTSPQPVSITNAVVPPLLNFGFVGGNSNSYTANNSGNVPSSSVSITSTYDNTYVPTPGGPHENFAINTASSNGAYNGNFGSVPTYLEVYNISETLFDGTILTTTYRHNKKVSFRLSGGQIVYMNNYSFIPYFSFSGLTDVTLTVLNGNTPISSSSITTTICDGDASGLYTYPRSSGAIAIPLTSGITFTYSLSNPVSYKFRLTYDTSTTTGVESDLQPFIGNFIRTSDSSAIDLTTTSLVFNQVGSTATISPPVSWNGPALSFTVTVNPITQNNYAITSASFNSATGIATLNFTGSLGAAPFSNVQTIIVSNIVVDSSGTGSYNGTFQVVSCSTTQVTYSIPLGGQPSTTGGSGYAGLRYPGATTAIGTYTYAPSSGTPIPSIPLTGITINQAYVIRITYPDSTFTDSIPTTFLHYSVAQPVFSTTNSDQIIITVDNLPYITGNTSVLDATLDFYDIGYDGKAARTQFGTTQNFTFIASSYATQDFTIIPSSGAYFNYNKNYYVVVGWNGQTYPSQASVYRFSSISFGTGLCTFGDSDNSLSASVTANGLSYGASPYGDNRLRVFIFTTTDSSYTGDNQPPPSLGNSVLSSTYAGVYSTPSPSPPSQTGTLTLAIGTFYYAEAWIPDSTWFSNGLNAAPTGTPLTRSFNMCKYNPARLAFVSSLSDQVFGTDYSTISYSVNTYGKTSNTFYNISLIKGASTVVATTAGIPASTITTGNFTTPALSIPGVSPSNYIPIQKYGDLTSISNTSISGYGSGWYRLQGKVTFGSGSSVPERIVYSENRDGTNTLISTFPYRTSTSGSVTSQYITYSYDDSVLTSTSLTADANVGGSSSLNSDGKHLKITFPWRGMNAKYFVNIYTGASGTTLIATLRSDTLVLNLTNTPSTITKTVDISSSTDMSTTITSFSSGTTYTAKLFFNPQGGSTHYVLASTKTFTYTPIRVGTITLLSVNNASATFSLSSWTGSTVVPLTVGAYVSGDLTKTIVTYPLTVNSGVTSITLSPSTGTTFTSGTTYVLQISYPDGTFSPTSNTFQPMNTSLTFSNTASGSIFTDHFFTASTNGAGDYGCIYLTNIVASTNLTANTVYTITLTLKEYSSASLSSATSRANDVFTISNSSTINPTSVLTGTVGITLATPYTYTIPQNYFSIGKYYVVTLDLLSSTSGSTPSSMLGATKPSTGTPSIYEPYGYDILVFAGQSNMAGRDNGQSFPGYGSAYSGGRLVPYETTAPPKYNNENFSAVDGSTPVFLLKRGISDGISPSSVVNPLGVSLVSAGNQLQYGAASGTEYFPLLSDVDSQSWGGVSLATEFVKYYSNMIGTFRSGTTNRRRIAIVFEPRGGSGFANPTSVIPHPTEVSTVLINISTATRVTVSGVTTATLNFSTTQASAPYIPGTDTIAVNGVTVTSGNSYNGNFTVLDCSTTQVKYYVPSGVAPTVSGSGGTVGFSNIYWNSDGGIRASPNKCGTLYKNLANAVQTFECGYSTTTSTGTVTSPNVAATGSHPGYTASSSNTYKCNRVMAFLWHQGESDALWTSGVTLWKQLVTDLVSDLILDLPTLFRENDMTFILGNLLHVFQYISAEKIYIPTVSSNNTSITHGVIPQVDLFTIPATNTYKYYSVSSLGLTPIDANAPSNLIQFIVHYSARSARMLGLRYFLAYNKVNSGLAFKTPSPSYPTSIAALDSKQPVSSCTYNSDTGMLSFKSTSNSYNYQNNPVAYYVTLSNAIGNSDGSIIGVPIALRTTGGATAAYSTATGNGTVVFASPFAAGTVPFSAGQSITITGVGTNQGYNGTFTVAASPSPSNTQVYFVMPTPPTVTTYTATGSPTVSHATIFVNGTTISGTSATSYFVNPGYVPFTPGINVKVLSVYASSGVWDYISPNAGWAVTAATTTSVTFTIPAPFTPTGPQTSGTTYGFITEYSSVALTNPTGTVYDPLTTRSHCFIPGYIQGTTEPGILESSESVQTNPFSITIGGSTLANCYIYKGMLTTDTPASGPLDASNAIVPYTITTNLRNFLQGISANNVGIAPTGKINMTINPIFYTYPTPTIDPDPTSGYPRTFNQGSSLTRPLPIFTNLFLNNLSLSSLSPNTANLCAFSGWSPSLSTSKSYSLSTASYAGTTATLNFSPTLASPIFVPGGTITVMNVTTTAGTGSYNGVFTVLTGSTTQVTYTISSNTPSAGGTGGFVNGPGFETEVTQIPMETNALRDFYGGGTYIVMVGIQAQSNGSTYNIGGNYTTTTSISGATYLRAGITNNSAAYNTFTTSLANSAYVPNAFWDITNTNSWTGLTPGGTTKLSILFNRLSYKGSYWIFFGTCLKDNLSQTPASTSATPVTASVNNPYPLAASTQFFSGLYNFYNSNNVNINYYGQQLAGFGMSMTTQPAGSAEPSGSKLCDILGISKAPFIFLNNTGVAAMLSLRNVIQAQTYTITYYISTRSGRVPAGQRCTTSTNGAGRYSNGGVSYNLLLTNPLPVRIFTFYPTSAVISDYYASSNFGANNPVLPIGQNIYFDSPPTGVSTTVNPTVVGGLTYQNLTTSFLHASSVSTDLWDGNWKKMSFTFTTPDVPIGTAYNGFLAYLMFGPLPDFRADYTGTPSAATTLQREYIGTCINIGGISCTINN